MDRTSDEVKVACKDHRSELLEEHPDIDLEDMLLLHDNTTPRLSSPGRCAELGLRSRATLCRCASSVTLQSVTKRQKILREKGIAGGMMPSCLSAQTTGILNRRSIAALAALVSFGQTSSSSSGDLLDSLFNDNGVYNDEEDDGPMLHNRGARQDIDERAVDVNVNVEAKDEVVRPSSHVLRVRCLTAFKNTRAQRSFVWPSPKSYQALFLTPTKIISIGQSLLARLRICSGLGWLRIGGRMRSHVKDPDVKRLSQGDQRSGPYFGFVCHVKSRFITGSSL